MKSKKLVFQDSTELQRKYKSKKEENESLKLTIKELRTENSRHITSNNELNIKLEQEQRERTILETNMTALTKTNQELSLKLQAEVISKKFKAFVES